jgi:hypothetical protein
MQPFVPCIKLTRLSIVKIKEKGGGMVRVGSTMGLKKMADTEDQGKCVCVC